MHHIYHTEGFVLGSRDYREADKYYFILTRDLGFVVARAQGIRKVSSKLRFVLQDYSYIKLDLVRAKDFWRITSVVKTNELENLINPKVARVVYNISRLLRRLLQGEEVNKILFEDVINGFRVLEKAEDKEEIHNIEAVLVLRILHNLGYIGGADHLEDLIKSPIESEVIWKAKEHRKKVLNHINRALKETHL